MDVYMKIINRWVIHKAISNLIYCISHECSDCIAEEIGLENRIKQRSSFCFSFLFQSSEVRARAWEKENEFEDVPTYLSIEMAEELCNVCEIILFGKCDRKKKENRGGD